MKRTYVLTITFETIDEDYFQFDYEPDERDLNRELADIVAEDNFPELYKNEETRKILVEELENLIYNEDDVKDAFFEMFGVKEELRARFYDEAVEDYFD